MNKNISSFEEAFSELETILQKMNDGNVPLEKLLELFEEGDTLLTYCQKKLTEAEKKIEILLKTREGNLSLDTQENPITSAFSEEMTAPLSHNSAGKETPSL